VGSIPIAVVGLIFRHQIEDSLRNLWVVGTALILWSIVMYVADTRATQQRDEGDFGMRDSVAMGLTQCVALIPGVSRSGATIAAGLFRGLDRVTVTRLSFFLAIPALTAAGVFEAVTKASDIASGVGWGPTIVALLVSFVVAYASVAWLLRYVSGHNFAIFILYRVALGIIILGLVATGASSAT
jgi:undecaprenyl-diphosphatase